MKLITAEMIMDKNPCSNYTPERVTELIGDWKTLEQILKLDISVADRIWVVTRFLDDKTNRAFAIWCAMQCKTEVKEITAYIDTIEKLCNGNITQDELNAANLASYSADYSAANSDDNSAAERKKQVAKLLELIDEKPKPLTLKERITIYILSIIMFMLFEIAILQSQVSPPMLKQIHKNRYELGNICLERNKILKKCFEIFKWEKSNGYKRTF